MTNPYDKQGDPNQSYDPTVYGQQYGSPDSGSSPYGSPQYPAPQPQYGAPQYGAPQYGAPQYGVSQYGAPQYGYGPAPDNNLVWAILATVMCCLPLGIVAIVKSTSVEKLWATGDFEGARKAAEDAKKWSIWSAVASVVSIVVFIVIYVVFFIVLIGSASVSTSTY